MPAFFSVSQCSSVTPNFFQGSEKYSLGEMPTSSSFRNLALDMPLSLTFWNSSWLMPMSSAEVFSHSSAKAFTAPRFRNKASRKIFLRKDICDDPVEKVLE